MSDNNIDAVDVDEFEMINPEDLPETTAFIPGSGISANSFEMPDVPTNKEFKVPTPVVDEDNMSDIDDGLRSFLSGGNQQSIKHPKRSQYERQFVEETYHNDYEDDDDYNNLEYEMDAIASRPRGIARHETGFKTTSELMRQFKKFMLSEVTDDPDFDVEELKFTLEDMMDMVELFNKQRSRRSKMSRVAGKNPIVRRGLNRDVYDVIDDNDMYMPDL